MIRRVLPLSIVSCVALWGCSGCHMNDPAPVTDPGFKDLSTQITVLTNKVDHLETEVQTIKAPGGPSQSAKTDPPGNDKAAESEAKPTGGTATAQSAKPDPNVVIEVAELKKQNQEVAGTLAKMDKKMRALVDLQDNQEDINRRFADYISGNRGQTPVLGKEVAPPTTGRLLIRNEMSSVQRVAVNGNTVYSVEPFETRTVTVVPGNITTQITGEQPLTWFIGAPKYSQEIIIAPASRNPLTPPTTTLQYDPFTGNWYSVSL